MAEVLPQQRHPGTTMADTYHYSAHTSLEMDHSDESSPDSNGTFVFPSQPSLSPPSFTSSRILPTSGPVPRGPHRQKPSKLSISTLPPFEFGVTAGGSPTKSSSTSPTRSPVRLTPPISHSSGHKRGGSEFVGGAITGGGPVLVSTSPHSSEEVTVVPPSPPKAPTGRRGHAHRRSGAVSQTDIKLILQPPSEHRGGSAPSTPSEPAFRSTRPAGPERSNSQPGRLDANETISGPPPPSRLRSEQAQNRSRVGFSDTVEFIPRPLSTISSDTSSSMSTIRASHTVTDSLGSIVSGGTSSPPSMKVVVSGEKNSTNDSFCGRGASLEDGYFRNAWADYATGSTSQATSTSLPMPEGESQRTNSTTCSIEETMQHSEDSQLDLQTPPAFTNSGSTCTSEDVFEIPERQPQRPRPFSSYQARPRTSPEPKLGKHRVRSWAGSFLHRRDKRLPVQDEAEGSPPSNPAYETDMNADFSLEDMNFDNDTTTIIEGPAFVPPPRPLTLQTKPPTTRALEELRVPGLDVSSPMIDLDAALGYQDQIHVLASDDPSERHPSAKRRLHSSRETGGFSGPGMNYHRRTESAPEMDHFDHSRYGFIRTGSNGAMDEAIEEEEEDVEPETTRKDPSVQGLGVNIVESEAASEEPIRRRRSGHSATDDNQMGFCHGTTSPNVASVDPVEIVDSEEEPRFSVLTKSSDECTITPTLSVEPLSQRPPSIPLDFELPTPSLTYGTTPETPSAVSSADYTKTSFDVHDIPRTHTANSSMTDRLTLDSSKAGDPCAASVDDVPSLTSSASTMFSNHPTRLSTSGNTTSAERSASFSAAVPARTRPVSASKRSSLASLSRLVGGSYNRSKLNIEESIPPDSPEKPEKKKRKRISRMMTFWKPKEKLSTS